MNRFLIFLFAGLIGALLAEKRGRDKLTWFILCLFFPPLILVLLVLPPKVAAGSTKSCPYCSRVIPEKDTACRFCRRELPIDMVKCGSCGNFVPDKEYCIHCNRKLR